MEDHIPITRSHFEPLLSGYTGHSPLDASGCFHPGQANNYAGHNLLYLRLDKRFSPNWSAALRLNNLADVRYAERADFAFGRFRYTPGRGRSLFVEIRYAQP